MGIASTRSQLTVCNLIIEGTLESLCVYKHGWVGVPERKIKRNKRFPQFQDLFNNTHYVQHKLKHPFCTTETKTPIMYYTKTHLNNPK